MTHRKDATPTRRTPMLRTSHGDRDKAGHASSGRVAFDDRGNSVWEFRIADNQYVRAGSTTLVRKLQPPPEVAIEATTIVRQPSEMLEPGRAVPLDVGHPNDRAQMGTVRTYPARSAAPTAKRPVGKANVASRARPGLLDRLFSRRP